MLEKLTDADLPWCRGQHAIDSWSPHRDREQGKGADRLWLQRGEWPDDDPDTFDERATLAEMRLVFATLREQRRYTDSFDEAGLEELIPCPEQWWEALRLDACRAARF